MLLHHANPMLWPSLPVGSSEEMCQAELSDTVVVKTKNEGATPGDSGDLEDL